MFTHNLQRLRFQVQRGVANFRRVSGNVAGARTFWQPQVSDLEVGLCSTVALDLGQKMAQYRLRLPNSEAGCRNHSPGANFSLVWLGLSDEWLSTSWRLGWRESVADCLGLQGMMCYLVRSTVL